MNDWNEEPANQQSVSTDDLVFWHGELSIENRILKNNNAKLISVIETQTQTISSLTAEKDSLEKSLLSKKKREDAESEEVSELKKQLAESNNRVKELESQRSGMEKEISQLRSDNSVLRQENDKLYATIEELKLKTKKKK